MLESFLSWFSASSGSSEGMPKSSCMNSAFIRNMMATPWLSQIELYSLHFVIYCTISFSKLCFSTDVDLQLISRHNNLEKTKEMRTSMKETENQRGEVEKLTGSVAQIQKGAQTTHITQTNPYNMEHTH